ncbi:MAG: hypothetical protein HN457_00305 [Opitutales bacterium]|jgi:hypothetical protein|nr:hypothetical protein [Opitutales bacterium]MBT5169037.1 hypothetical protein [Opitutales bacterium]MBT5813817.1 hypothetical protein [Opitutales bacterium]MBT6767606.1 hypothetical protein [Opitutales bacterium]
MAFTVLWDIQGYRVEAIEFGGLWIILDVGHCQVLRTEIVVWTVAVYDEYIVGAKGDQFTIYICGF